MNENEWETAGRCFTGDTDRHVITPSRILYGRCARGHLYHDNETPNASTYRRLLFSNTLSCLKYSVRPAANGRLSFWHVDVSKEQNINDFNCYRIPRVGFMIRYEWRLHSALRIRNGMLDISYRQRIHVNGAWSFRLTYSRQQNHSWYEIRCSRTLNPAVTTILTALGQSVAFIDRNENRTTGV